MEPSSLPNLFSGYLTESNISSQLLILHIKMEPSNIHGEPYFPWQGVSLLSQNCPKTCEFIYWWLQGIIEIIVIIETQEKTHMKVLLLQNQIWITCIFLVWLIFVKYKKKKKMKLDPCCEKGIFVGYDEKSPAYLI